MSLVWTCFIIVKFRKSGVTHLGSLRLCANSQALCPRCGHGGLLGGGGLTADWPGPGPWPSRPLLPAGFESLAEVRGVEGPAPRAVPPHPVFTTSSLSGRAENYWWRGQNTRTLCVGPFPRNVVTSVAGLSAQDISQPLQNSFIHTGHGDSDPRHCWGFPDKIDE